MPRAYSQDLRWRAIFLIEIVGIDIEEVSFYLQISEKTLSRYVSKFRRMGNVNTEIIGRPYGCISLHPHEEWVIMELLLEHPEKSLAEIADVLYSETGSANLCSTLCRYLKRNNITRKKLVNIALQRSEDARAHFRAVTCLLPPEMFVFIDESGFDKRICRTNGYSWKGQRATVKRTRLAWRPRITAIPVVCTEGLLDVATYNGHVTGETFLDFVNTTLAPCLLPFDGFNPRSVVILDNAAIHHTQEVLDAMNATGALVIFLPPYSPDFMPCEELFSKAKHYIRENDIAWQNCPEPSLMVFESFLQVTDNEIQNYIEHADYL